MQAIIHLSNLFFRNDIANAFHALTPSYHSGTKNRPTVHDRKDTAGHVDVRQSSDDDNVSGMDAGVAAGALAGDAACKAAH